MLTSRSPRGILFLGGLFSALFLALSLPPYDRRPLAWFALIPLLFSLCRQRDHWPGRVLHALSFGLIIAGWCLWPLIPAAFLESTRGGASVAGALWSTTLEGAGTFAIVVVSWVLFAVVSGPLLRQRMVWIPWLGLPFVWTGLEFLRCEALPVTVPYLTLASGVDPAMPEAQVASVLGQWGLSFCVCLANVSFALALRERGWLRQLVLVLLGTGLFLGLFAGGSISLRRAEKSTDLRVAMVVQSGRSEQDTEEDKLRPIRMVLEGEPVDLVLLPRESVLLGTAQGAVLLSGLRDLARDEDLYVLVGVTTAAPTPPEPEGRETGAEPDIEVTKVAGDDERPGLYLIDREGRIAARVTAVTRPLFGLERARRPWEKARPIRMTETLVGAAVGPDFYGTRAARQLTAQGATLLLSSDRDPHAWRRPVALLHARMSELRAVENRRWLLRATHGGRSAFVSPEGRSIDRFSPEFSWPAVEEVALRERLSVFTRGGWLFGPLTMSLGLLITIATAFPWLWRRGAEPLPQQDDPRLWVAGDPPYSGAEPT